METDIGRPIRTDNIAVDSMPFLARLLLLSSAILAVTACAPGPSSKTDSKAVSRSYLSTYVNTVMKPPRHSFYNGHPSAEIRVDYELSKQGSATTRHTVLVKPYANVVVTTTDYELTVTGTDFTDPYYRGETTTRQAQ